MQLLVDGLMTHYETAGTKGPVVLLLHGWADRLETFATLQKVLSNSYRTVALDLPGFGTTEAPSSVWNLDNYAQFVKLFLSKTGLQPYACIGHSNGGALLIRAVSLGEVEPQKLVLLAASGIRPASSPRRTLFKIIAKEGKVATVFLPERYRQKLRKKLYGAAGSDMLVAPHLQETFKVTVRQDVQADAAKLKVPTLLIYGSKDRATPAADGQKYHQLIKDSRLEIVPSEHFVHQEQAEKVAELIKEFLA
jgi:pimeloyl-ACP methyl ester carboxylesterase